MFKECFPAFKERTHWAYWDSAATALKLGVGLEAQRRFEEHQYANVHRSSYQLAAVATDCYESARAELAEYFDALVSGCVFVRGATEGINVFAQAVVAPNLQPGSNIVVSQAEHHANYWVWKALCAQKGAECRVAAAQPSGHVDLEHLLALVDDRTCAVAVTHASNVTGAVNPLGWIREVKARGAWVLVDGAQYAAHEPVSVEGLGCDAYVVSSHKLGGPNGVGVLMLSARAIDSAHPYQWGGGMAVFHKGEASRQPLPWGLEAGTPHIGGAIGFAAVCRWWREHRSDIEAHRASVEAYWRAQWSTLGLPSWTDPDGLGIIAFEVPGVHPHDVASWCDQAGVAVRSGMHCAGPFLESLGKIALVRASMGVYTDPQDVDALVKALHGVSTDVLE